MLKFKRCFFITSALLAILTIEAASGDWPMWRYDAGRTASSPEELPEELHLLWTRHYTQRDPVWDDPLNRDLMPYDQIFEPIVIGKTMFIGFNDCDKVVALDTESGKQKWVFYVDGPIRLPLAAWRDRLFFTGDDGFLYCLSTGEGKLLWKFRGGPSDRKILGNKRLISTWPARGGVVIKDGIVYFAASIWPFMGTFIYALDAETGSIVWRNEATGAQYMKQPHNSPSFAGVGPQGAFAIGGKRLLVSGGRSVPACFDRLTGEFIYFHIAANNKTGGGFVCANHQYFFNHARERLTDMYDLEQGHELIRRIGKYPVLTKRVFYFSGETITARDAASPDDKLWQLETDASGDLIRAGSRLYTAGENHITALQISPNGEKPQLAWRKNIRGKVERVLAANGKLFAVTLDGRIMAFGAKKQKARDFPLKPTAWQPSPEIAVKAKRILDQSNTQAGYALCYGAGNGELLAGLALSSNLNIIAVEPDSQKINKLRHWLNALGIYGERVSLLPGTLNSFQPPPYLAALTIIGDLKTVEFRFDEAALQKIYQSMRPYGGKAWLPLTGENRDKFTALVRTAGLPGAKLEFYDNAIILSREGPLPGASDWTHQYGNIANTVKSDDARVKMPLGMLWFGGNSNVDVLPRHGHGPPEQVIGGRLFIAGMDRLSARDVYTGRVLWKARFDSSIASGMYYDHTYENTPLNTSYNQKHIPGANARGTNFVATTDLIYVIQRDTCHVLDAVTGKTIRYFTLPVSDTAPNPEWAYIGVLNNFLIAGSGFVPYSAFNPLNPSKLKDFAKLSPKKPRKLKASSNYDKSASQKLVVMDRHTGVIKWQLPARYGFIHNAIAASDNTIFCLDKLPPHIAKKLKRRGLPLPDGFRLLALDANNGEIVWKKETDIFGSWLGYSHEHDLLLQATRPSRDMLSGEDGKRMIVYKAADGTRLWDRNMKYKNPPILHGAKIITDHSAYNIFTGERISRRDPLTGETIPWRYTRMYGCNYNIASEHLLSFRSAAAGFYDLLSDGGTGNFGGFKTGCTSTLVVADGVLNSPDYTRTCQCSYPNQTSLALVNFPGLEYWTFNDFSWSGEPIKRVGINFNAPGDRMADNGSLWLDFPSVGGKSPDIPVKIKPQKPESIRRHSLFLAPDGLPWVAASGLKGNLMISITLSEKELSNSSYTVHLHFAELEDKKPGERVFDVSLQNRRVLNNFDIAEEAAGVNRGIIKTFHSIPVRDQLIIECTAAETHPACKPLICGIELVMEK